MTDREKVIKGLEAHLNRTYGSCPYDEDFNCIGSDPLLRDALDLLKAQEPRVMTLAEALAADYVYLEIKLHASLPCKSYGDVCAVSSAI